MANLVLFNHRVAQSFAEYFSLCNSAKLCGFKMLKNHREPCKTTPKPEVVWFHPSGASNILGGVLLLTYRSSGAG